MYYSKLLICYLICMLLLSCDKIEFRSSINPKGSNPDVITNVQIQNFPGYAIISYDLPKNEDLLYIMAEYKINAHSTRQAKATLSTNKIKVEGFNDMGIYDVTLYAVSKSELRSKPVVVQVNPETPPFRLVLESLDVQKAFGGINITFENPSADNIAINVITTDENSSYYNAYTHYTTSKGGKFSARGFEAEERIFGLCVRDKFNNKSDTLFFTLTPLVERLLDKTLFSEYVMPNDTPVGHGWVRTNLWDNDVNTGYHTPEPVQELPGLLTIDLGVTTTLSRFKIWQRNGYFFSWGNPREWAIYGSNNPNPSGALDDTWVHLMDCVSIKPSGEGGVTADDNLYATAGEEYELPPDQPSIRYIRLVLKRSWSDSPRFHFMELSFWGA